MIENNKGYTSARGHEVQHIDTSQTSPVGPSRLPSIYSVCPFVYQVSSLPHQRTDLEVLPHM